MNQTSGFMLVDEAKLAAHPQALRQYVERYFERIMVSDVPYFAAIRTLTSVSADTRRGIAPMHLNDLRRFTDGLPKDMNLYEWLREVAEQPESGVTSFFRSWDDGCIGSVLDD